MNQSLPPQQDSQPQAELPVDRKRPPVWILLALVVLFGGWFTATQIHTRSGPPIAWVRDLEAAQRLAREQGRRIFLLLHEPGCKITESHDRDLFTQRFAREILARMVPCRIELQRDDPLRWRFQFRGPPLMLVLEPGSDRPLGGQVLEGKIERLQFETYVNPGRPDERK